MKSRKDYMDGKISHEEYYRQFVTDAVKNIVASRIGVAWIERSCDPHLNDIPLNRWDNLAPALYPLIGEKMKQAGDGLTLAGAVCVAKQAARMLTESAFGCTIVKAASVAWRSK